MIKKLLSIIGVMLISVVSTIGVYRYAPIAWFETQAKQVFGTSITTINGSDTLSNSRTTINNNFSALNSGKVENSDLYATTTMTQITSLPNLITSALQTVGTIMTGVWNGTAIGVGYGGTGTTTPTSNQVIIGNGSSGFKVIGFGTSGQFLQSNGNATAPSWNTISGSTLTTSFTAGETIAISQPVYVENVAQLAIVGQATASGSTDNIDDGGGMTKYGEKFTEATSSTISKLSLGVSKSGSPTGNITLSIQANSAGNPSGVSLSSCTISAGSVTGSFQLLSCTLATPYATTGGTTYHMVAEGNGVNDAGNYWTFYRDPSDGYANGNGERYSGSWSSLSPNDITFSIGDTHTIGRIYPTSGSSANSSNAFVGFTQSAVSSGSSTNIITDGLVTSMSVATGTVYYLGNATSTLSTSAGTNSHKAFIGTDFDRGIIINSF